MKLVTCAHAGRDAAAVAGRNAAHCQCSRRLCVVTITHIVVTSLLLMVVCALAVSTTQQNISVNKLQQQVAELQRTVIILHYRHHHQQQQSRAGVSRLDTSHQQDEQQTSQVSEPRCR